jgi:hypothetical protein
LTGWVADGEVRELVRGYERRLTLAVCAACAWVVIATAFASLYAVDHARLVRAERALAARKGVR